MVLTIESAQAMFSGNSSPSPIPAILDQFNQLSTEDQLALLWYAYTETGQSITPAALSASSMFLIEDLLDRIQRMSGPEQTQVMFDLVRRADSPISRSYSSYSANTKLGFWYQLARWMADGLVAPIQYGYELSSQGQELFETLKQLDGGQQIQILRDIVVNMGYDPSIAKVAAEPVEFDFIRTEPVAAAKPHIEGIKEPVVLAYFEAMNTDNFDAAVALFAPDGALQPPFREPIVGHQAIAAYMREEAKGLTLMPQQGISQVLGDGSKQLKITGKVQTPWFGVNVAMNIAWRFALNPEGKIFYVGIDLLASPQELLNLRPDKLAR
ncbi:orange carotenoid protein N-terminal domain-containing protein [Gloeobacter violaceus]|uniref:orange carotenoid protein N-terminal domain-containing protein n=1 Tax=Gloeobacter violaceus TaxID=33072 RepID=UPI0002EFFE2C|nr:orange carotenoid protein N-terminal domain-containing protein [Gloeobacter violaceus]